MMTMVMMVMVMMVMMTMVMMVMMVMVVMVMIMVILVSTVRMLLAVLAPQPSMVRMLSAVLAPQPSSATLERGGRKQNAVDEGPGRRRERSPVMSVRQQQWVAQLSLRRRGGDTDPIAGCGVASSGLLGGWRGASRRRR